MKLMLTLCLLFGHLSAALALSSYEDQTAEISTQLSRCGSTAVDGQVLKARLRNKYLVDSGASMEFLGVELHAVRPELVRHMIDLLTIDGNRKKKSYFSVSDLSQKYSGINRCKNVFCIADRIFGKGLGAYYLYFMDEYNLNLSHMANQLEVTSGNLYYESIKRFSLSELNAVYDALRVMPKGAFEYFNYGTHVKRSKRRKGNTIANATISFFELWGDIDRQERIVTVIHEIGHRLADYLDSTDTSEEWANISGWTFDRSSFMGIYEATRVGSSAGFVSNYALTNPVEDFAESFTAYILAPKFLKSRSSAKFQYLKKYVFGEGQSCKVVKKYPKLEVELSTVEQSEIASSCLETFLETLSSLDMKEYNRCVAKGMIGSGALDLSYAPSVLSNALKGNSIYTSIVTKNVDQIVSTLRPEYLESCTENSSLLFEIFSPVYKEYPLKLAGMTAKLCRWTHKVNEIDGLINNEKNLTKSMRKLLLQRAL